MYLKAWRCQKPADSGCSSPACAVMGTALRAPLPLHVPRRAATATLFFTAPSPTGWSGRPAAPVWRHRRRLPGVQPFVREEERLAPGESQCNSLTFWFWLWRKEVFSLMAQPFLERFTICDIFFCIQICRIKKKVTVQTWFRSVIY